MEFLVSDFMLKVNFKPYVLIIDLLHAVDIDDVVVKMIDGFANILLHKVSKPIYALYLQYFTSQLYVERSKVMASNQI